MVAALTVDIHPLPLSLDEVQAVHMAIISREGCSIASPGTRRFEEMQHLVDLGYLKHTECPEAGGVHQFEITDRGRTALEAES